MITANTFRPSEEATANRFENIDFTFNEKKDIQQKEEFNNKYKPKAMTDNAPLSVLKSIGGFIASRIIEEPELLKTEWKKLSEQLLEEAYTKCGLEIPQWVREWTETETIEDIEEEAYTMVIDLLKREINRAYNIKIQIIDDEGRQRKQEDIVTENLTTIDVTMTEKAHHVISTSSISWLTAKEIKNKEYVLISYPFVKMVEREIGLSESLNSLSEMLGWDKITTKIGGKSIKFIGTDKVSFYRTISYEGVEEVQDTL